MAVLTHPRGDIEYHVYPGDPDLPELVFLHEGLGSVAQWGRLPARLNQSTGMRTLVYSRHGYGGSHGHLPDGPDYLHDQARTVLPEVLSAVGFGSEPILIGHSDGATIAAIYAAHHRVRGCVLIAPHLVFEEYTADAIRSTAKSFDRVRDSLSVFHGDPDALFEAWSGVWLSPEFAGFDITDELSAINSPVLATQGDADEYGTEIQLELVTENVAGPATSVLLPGVGHHPHLHAGDELIALIDDFVHRIDG